MPRTRPKFSFLVALLAASPVFGRNGELELRVSDKDTDQPIAVRMHLRDSRARPPRVKEAIGNRDFFYFHGSTVLDLPAGKYWFDIQRGPEYRIRTGHFTIERGATDNKSVNMERFIDMKNSGWWSGDLHCQLDAKHVPLMMAAEDLHVAPVVSWARNYRTWRQEAPSADRRIRLAESRFVDLTAGRAEAGSGRRLLFRYPSPIQTIIDGHRWNHQAGVAQSEIGNVAHVDLEAPFALDMPLWVSQGSVDSIGLAHGHMRRDGVLDEETQGKPRDRLLFPPPHGNARWSEHIYYNLLECGLRMPPSAGSGAGMNPNPLGYNRVYVHCGPELNYDGWWNNLRQGRVVVTNGPLIQPTVNRQLPGHVFAARRGEELELTVSLHLATREKIDYLEIIKNGQLDQHVRLDAWAAAGGKLPPVVFTSSGWMLVRAVTNNQDTFRFASSGPYYVEVDGRRRVSRRAAEFFVKWIYERARQIRRRNDLDDVRDRLLEYRESRNFWQGLVHSVTVD